MKTTKCYFNKLAEYSQKEKGISTNLKIRELTRNNSVSPKNSEIGARRLIGKKFSEITKIKKKTKCFKICEMGLNSLIFSPHHMSIIKGDSVKLPSTFPLLYPIRSTCVSKYSRLNESFVIISRSSRNV